MPQLVNKGFQILIEKSAGELSNFSDQDYTESGATLAERKEVLQADIVTQINPPKTEDISLMKRSKNIINVCFLKSRFGKFLCKTKISAFSLDAIPRTSLAQVWMF